MSPPRERPLQVAAVCYRKAQGQLELLLVRTLDGRWTFPKGQIDHGMSEVEAAEAEAFEEAGAAGPVEHHPLTSYVYTKGNPNDSDTLEIQVNAYLMQVRTLTTPLEPHRDPQWFSPQAARDALAEGRIGKYAREMARVIDAAVARVTV